MRIDSPLFSLPPERTAPASAQPNPERERVGRRRRAGVYHPAGGTCAWARAAARRLHKRAGVLVACVLPAMLAPPLAAGSGHRLPATQPACSVNAVAPAFAVRHTPHFLIAHDPALADIEPFAARAEQVYDAVQRLCNQLGIVTHPPPDALEVLYFRTREAYERYGRGVAFEASGTWGFFHETTNRAAFFEMTNDPAFVDLERERARAERMLGSLERQVARMDPVAESIRLRFGDGREQVLTRTQAEAELARIRRQLQSLSARLGAYREMITRTVMQHELAHQVMFHIGLLPRGGAAPPWLVEGLATLFEVPFSSSAGVLDEINQARLKDLRAALMPPSVRLLDRGAGILPATTCRQDACTTTREARVPQTAPAAASIRGSPDARAFVAAMRDGRLAPIEELLTSRTLFDARGDKAAAYYAQAWSLVYYLCRTQPGPFAAYLRTFSGQPTTTRTAHRELAPLPEDTQPNALADFERFFGPVDEHFMQRWAQFVVDLSHAR